MANNSMNFNVNFNSTFDSSQILKGLEEVRKKMGAMSADEQIFKGVDKEFAKLKTLLATLDAQQKNLGTASGLNAYNRTLERVRESAARISQNLTTIAANDDKAFNSKDVIKYQEEIGKVNIKLEQEKAKLTELQSAMGEKLGSLGFSSEEADEFVQRLTVGGEQSADLFKEAYIKRIAEINEAMKKVQMTTVKWASPNSFSVVNKQKTFSGNIADVGVTGSVANAGMAVENIVKTSFADAVRNGQTLEQLMTNINSSLNSFGITLRNNNIVVEEIERNWSLMTNEITAAENEEQQVRTQTDLLTNSIQEAHDSQTGLVQDVRNLKSEYMAQEQIISDTEGKLEESAEKMEQASNEMDSSLGELGQDAEQAEKEVEDLIDAEQDVNKEREEGNRLQKELNAQFDRMSNAVKNVLSIGNAWRQVNRYIRQTFQDIQKLDTAFGSIAMVTNYQVGDLWEQYENYSEIANRLGQTTEGAIKSSALFYQQG